MSKSFRSERDFFKKRSVVGRRTFGERGEKRVFNVCSEKDKEVGKAIGISARQRFNGRAQRLGRTIDDKTPERSRRRVKIKRSKKSSRACFFTAYRVKMGVLARIGDVFLRRLASRRSAAVRNGNDAFEERRKDAEFLRTASVNVGAARRLQRGEIGVAGKARLAVASGRRSFSNEKRLDLTVLNRKIASD